MDWIGEKSFWHNKNRFLENGWVRLPERQTV